jgi:hypothetical protein
VEEQIRQVVARGVQPAELAIHHVRDPSQWMPITGISGLKGPEHAGPGQAGFDRRVVADIDGIIEVYEVVGGHRPVAGQGY